MPNHIAAMLLIAVALCGCGQTGPLYMPAPEPPQENVADQAPQDQPQDKGA